MSEESYWSDKHQRMVTPKDREKISLVLRLQRENDELKALCEKLKLEAQIHAGEDDIHKSIIYGLYQSLGIRKGDWNGAKPVVDKFTKLTTTLKERDTEIAELKAVASEHERFIAGVVNARWSDHSYHSQLANEGGDLLSKPPTQSLHDYCAKCTNGERSERDMRIAEKVREVCVDNCTEGCGCANDVHNINLEEVVKDGITP